MSCQWGLRGDERKEPVSENSSLKQGVTGNSVVSIENNKTAQRESWGWLDVRLLTFSSLNYSLPRLWKRRDKLGRVNNEKR